MSVRVLTLAGVLAVALVSAVSATTYVVSPDGTGDFPTIQAAIDACAPYDVIELTDGTFTGDGNRDLDYGGKSLTIKSQSGIPANCIIDCEGTPENAHRAADFHTGEDAGAVLEGITITNGYHECGGGISVIDASPSIRNCVITSCTNGGIWCREADPLVLEDCTLAGNVSYYSGAGIHVSYGHVSATGCSFLGNVTRMSGGGLSVTVGGATIASCYFEGNQAEGSGGGICNNGLSWSTATGCTFVENSADVNGGGLSCGADDGVTLRNCTFYANAAYEDGGGIYGDGYFDMHSHLTMENCCVAFSADGAGVFCGEYCNTQLSCCDLYGNAGGDWIGEVADQYGIDGNIALDPFFCRPEEGDLTLLPISPCAPFTYPNEECDLIGAWPATCDPLTVSPNGSGDFPTIQAAIDAAADGDVIHLTPGTFLGAGNRDVDLRGKSVRILAQSGVSDAAVIDCEHAGRGFIAQSGEGLGTEIYGVTITGGRADFGGGILCDDSSPRISFCTLIADSATEMGGAIACVGGGAPTIRNCTIRRNAAAVGGAGIYASDGAAPEIAHTIIAFSTNGDAVCCDDFSSASLACCDLYGNAWGDWVGCIASQYGVDGNICEDPRFSGPEDCYLANGSPCKPFSPPNESCPLIGAWPVGCFPPLIVHPDGSGDYATIQAAIDASIEGEIIELVDGTFNGVGNRDLDFGGKSITIRSQSGDPDACVIDCQSAGRGFIFQSGEESQSVLRGIGITNGLAMNGAGILCNPDGSPSILNCKVFGNHAAEYGGGLYCDNGSNPLVQACTFDANQADVGGGGIGCAYAGPQIVGCAILSNSAPSGGGISCAISGNVRIDSCLVAGNMATERGGGVFCVGIDARIRACTFFENTALEGGGAYCRSMGSPVFEGCTFQVNTADDGGGMYCYQFTTPVIANCTFYANSAPNGSGLRCANDPAPQLENVIIAFGIGGGAFYVGTGEPTLSCCNLFGNEGGDWVGYVADQYGQDGNICADPLFCDAGSGDFSLHSDSPCAPYTWPNLECDLIGAWAVGCGSAGAVCCVDGTCQVLTADECDAYGGEFMPGMLTCDPNPCLLRACCIGESCEVLSMPGCHDAGGEWLPEWDGCDPDPCAPQILVVEPDGSGDYATIQSAIDAAEDGDIVELTDGVFSGFGNRSIDFRGKAIAVRSWSGDATTCTIDCEGNGRGFWIHRGEGSQSILENITITGGNVSSYGGGIYCDNASPTLFGCILNGNQAGFAGGGIACFNEASPNIQDCIFRNNAASSADAGYGGGLYCGDQCVSILDSCVFVGNSALYRGGGIDVHMYSEAVIRSCTLYQNAAPNGSGIGCRHHALVQIENTIIAFGEDGSAVFCEMESEAAAVCCDLFGNSGGDWVDCVEGQLGLDGNICEDPLFCDPENGDFALQGISPCAPFSPPNPECDLIGAWPVGCDPQEVRDPIAQPMVLCLRRPAPNPFTTATRLTFTAPSAVQGFRVQLAIYDLTGRRVRALVDGWQFPGLHAVTWDARDGRGVRVPNGIYFSRLEHGEASQVRRLVLID